MADDPGASSLQRVVDSKRLELESASHSASAQGWLRPRLDTAAGMDQVYGYLQAYVKAPEFLAKLVAARGSQAAKQADEEAPRPDVRQPEWWQLPGEQPGSPQAEDSADAEDGFSQVSTEEEAAAKETEPLDAYVIVEKDDVMDAMATFVAAYLMQLPEAQHLKPQELQKALDTAIGELRQGRVRRLWGWGRCLYRCLAFSYGAFSVYENPWIVRALLTAMWTASRLLIGLL